jgi:hypothetical protein
MMVNPSTDIIPNAWDALASRLTPAQREAAMRPGSALVLAGAGNRQDLDAHGLGCPQDRGREASSFAPPRRHFH